MTKAALRSYKAAFVVFSASAAPDFRHFLCEGLTSRQDGAVRQDRHKGRAVFFLQLVIELVIALVTVLVIARNKGVKRGINGKNQQSAKT